VKVSRICLGHDVLRAKSWREWILSETRGAPSSAAQPSWAVNFYDTADVYSNGRDGGHGQTSQGGLSSRGRIRGASKVFNPMGDKPTSAGCPGRHILKDRRFAPAPQARHIGPHIIHRLGRHGAAEEVLEALHDS